MEKGLLQRIMDDEIDITGATITFPVHKPVGERQNSTRDDGNNSITDELQNSINWCRECSKVSTGYVFCFQHEKMLIEKLNLI